MPTLRLFFAIVFPRETQVRLSSSLKTLQRCMLSDYIRWVHVEKMHITLQFLGNLPQEQLMLVTENARAVIKNIPAFQLELGHLEWFPSVRHPKILSLSVQPQAALATLSDTIGKALIALNVPVESRPFRGHMTMGRVIRHGLHYDVLGAIRIPDIPPVMVNKIHLVESRFERGGQNYFPLAEFKLASSQNKIKSDDTWEIFP